MLIQEERIKEALYNQLGLNAPLSLLYRHLQRGEEVYLVSWLMERPNPKNPTDLIEPNNALRMHCDKNGIDYQFPPMVLWSSRISPGRIAIVGQISTNGPGSEKLYFIRDTNRAGIYIPIMEPYLICLKGNMENGKNGS